MTPRERWLAVLKGEKPDRVPMGYRANPPVALNIARRLPSRPAPSHLRNRPAWGRHRQESADRRSKVRLWMEDRG